MAAMGVGVGLKDLAELIFIANKNDAVIEITFGQLEGPKELFFFLLHLLCKGIVLISGNGSFGSVTLDDMPISVLQSACRKLENIGVRCSIVHESTSSPGPPSIRCEELRSPVVDVSDMCLVLRTQTHQLVRVTFEIRRILI